MKFKKSPNRISQTNNADITKNESEPKMNIESKTRIKLVLALKAAKEVLVNSTSHGIPNIVKSDRLIIKLVWLVFLLASTSLCSYLVAQSVFSYFNYDVNTKTRIIYERQVPFPTITICNKQRYTTEYAFNFLKDVIKENNLSDVLNETVRNSLFGYTLLDSLSLIKDKAKLKIKQLGLTYSNETKNFDFSNAYNLIECKLNGYPFICIDSYWYYNKDYGNCLVLNSGFNSSGYPIDITSINFAGKSNGLSITMFLGCVDELKYFEPNFGLIIKIENGSNGLVMDPIEIAAGYETNIAVEREFTQQLANPYSNCDLDNHSPISFDRKYYNILAEMNIKYKESICIDLC